MSSRRKFIKDSCTACIGLIAMTSMASLLSSCASLRVYTTTVEKNTIQVPLASILPDEKMKIIRSKTLAYDILLIVHANKMHKAFLMKCSHQDSMLVATNSGMSCNLHGSMFNLEGQPTKGPASRPLQLLKTSEDNNYITIWLS